jgi:hypothetical protein
VVALWRDRLRRDRLRHGPMRLANGNALPARLMRLARG